MKRSWKVLRKSEYNVTNEWWTEETFQFLIFYLNIFECDVELLWKTKFPQTLISYNLITFHCSLFLRIKTLLKSTLLLKNKCFDLFIWKHNVYKQMRCSIIVERKRAWEARWGRERVALIKSLITWDRKKDTLEARLPNQAKNVSWYPWYINAVDNVYLIKTFSFSTERINLVN